MLRTLILENIALVEKASLALEPGLTVLTGETGAGKSVIVQGLSLALGGRAEKEYIRHGADSAIVAAVFSDPSDGRDTAVMREINLTGNARVRIDDSPATVTQLKELVEPMAQILGQHAGQMLMNEDNHLEFVDTFAGLLPERDAVARLFGEWRRAADELKRIRRRRDQLAAERELLLFQKHEIEQAAVRIGEEEELENERRILDSARDLMESATQITEAIGGDDTSVLTMLAAARKELDKMAEIDSTLEKQSELLADLDFQLEDLRRFIEQYGSGVQDDPARLEEINLRLDELYNLRKKYGGSEEAILATLDRINTRLTDRPDTDSLISTLEKDTDKHYKAYSAKAVRLTDSRRAAAAKLEKLVIAELKELAIDRADFRCDFIYEDDESGVILEDRAVRPYEFGLERIRFLFSANPGEPLRPLVKTASGGEVSRVLLALKTAELRNRGLQHSLLVFDEVDVGIGGQTANEVARKLKKLSDHCQVLVITHLHQIARLADHHFVAEKSVIKGKRTVITVRKLDREGVAAELDRMVALPEPNA